MIKAWTDEAWEVDYANRIVYRIEGGIIKIVQCGTHYRDK